MNLHEFKVACVILVGISEYVFERRELKVLGFVLDKGSSFVLGKTEMNFLLCSEVGFQDVAS